ncbi:MAG: hypothetical protein IJF83_09845 [Methanobrevibacter sp.]|nr:hypothetical protein [Methanobrevibacter sp.]
MAEKSKITALVISFIFTGLGIAYLGNVKKGVTLFAARILLSCMGFWVHWIFSRFAIIVWIVALYLTWREAEAVCR